MRLKEPTKDQWERLESHYLNSQPHKLEVKKKNKILIRLISCSQVFRKKTFSIITFLNRKQISI